MRQPLVDDIVRLTSDVPELELCRGEIGIVRSTWFAPTVAYEVEFECDAHHSCTRTLLRADQLTVEPSPEIREPAVH